ncbi:hypothetical protein FACS1894217_01940 [Clostridia bacterium]|nr:hypothetical protein FACS1894217_01940 [Clostridia bacterium]
MSRDIVRSIFVWVGIIFLFALIILCFSNETWSATVKLVIDWVLGISGFITLVFGIILWMKKKMGD